MKTVSKLVAFTLALAIIFTLPVPTLATENPFDDVSEGAWYYDDVMLVVSAHVMEGTDAVHFAPDATLTRAMMATILWRLAGAPEGNPCAFTDVENGSWYYQAVAWAQTTGIVSGIGNNQFAPNNSVTREQMAAMVYNFAARQYSLRSYLPTTTCELTHFTDASRISTYAVEPVRWLVSWNGLHCEGNALQPRQNATRAEVAASVAVFLRETNTPANYTGKSAYELAVENGYIGSVQEWLASLVGPAGKSAYELAVDHGYQGTEEAWLNSLSGKSAYEIALDHGFEGTEAEWLDSLHGDDGTSVVNAQVDASYHLIITLSDGTEIDAGYVGVEVEPSENPITVYTVTFADYDGTVLKTQQVEEGESATPPANPTRPGYTFSGWSGSYTNVHADVTITATYVKDDVYFTITFVDYDGTVLKTEQVLEGNDATPPENPARFGYIFSGWIGSYTNIHSNTTITAGYSEITAPTIVVRSTSASLGDGTVSVTISILNNPGISSLKLSVDYDSCLMLSDVVFDPGFGSYVTAPQPYANPQTISLMSPLNDISVSGTFATLTFAISNSVTAPTVAHISVEYDQENTFDVNFDDVVFQVVNGSVAIS